MPLHVSQQQAHLSLAILTFRLSTLVVTRNTFSLYNQNHVFCHVYVITTGGVLSLAVFRLSFPQCFTAVASLYACKQSQI